MNWTELYTVNGLPPAGMNYITLNTPANLRYVRYQVPEGTPSNGYNQDNVYCCNLAEIAVFGTESAIVPGDANDDGSLTTADLLMVEKWLLGYGELTNWKNADLCEDNIIDVFDLCLLRKELIKQGSK